MKIGELRLDEATGRLLEELPGEQRQRLAEQVEAAAAAQKRQLESALEEAASFLPGPLRRQARKLLF